ncbi:MAG TPA: class I SAM-dependent methyltransferase [Oculatellaceae cyanobacterium]
MASKTGALDNWTPYYRQSASDGTALMWPSETLIRLFKGSYVPGLEKDYAGKKILDVGFGGGNNLPLYASLGLKISGTEVSQDICDAAGQQMQSLNHECDLRIGTNRSLPFEENEFDFLVSWNVLHYEDNESDISKGLSEYRRVLKPSGRLFVSTTGPDHMILKNSKTLGAHRYQIGREDDFRKGETYFYFDAPNYIEHYFGEFFDDVLVGRTHDVLFTDTLDWFIVTGLKR